jgi:AcrR family transcriptional regulator
VFLERGFHRATVDDVADRAEVSKGTVYLYFESKETILAHLLLSALGELVQELERANAAHTALPASDRLRELCWSYLHFFEREPRYLQFLMAADRGRFRESVSAQVYQDVLEASLEGLDLAVSVIGQGVADGTIECSDPRGTAAVMWATLNGVLELMQHPLRREMVGIETDALHAYAIETLIGSLGGSQGS